MPSVKGIVSSLIGIIVVFYLLSSLYKPLETSALSLNSSLAASTISGIPALGTLPGVAVLIVVLVFIFGIIIAVTRLMDEG